MDCQCVNWCRVSADYNGRSKDGLPLFTDHHPGCEHYNDSLIKVFKVEYDGQRYYTKEKPTKEETDEGEIVTEAMMHSEIFDQLPEFNGF